MHAFRSLMVLLFAVSASFGQEAKTVPSTAVTVRVCTIPESAYQRIQSTWSETQKTALREPLGVKSDVLESAMQSLQAHRRSTLMQMPKPTLTNSRAYEAKTGTPRTFTTGYDKQEIGGKSVLIPKTEIIWDGFITKVIPKVSDNGTTVSLAIKAQMNSVNPNPSHVPFSMLIESHDTDGKPTKSIPFTCFYQKPEVQTVAYQGEISLRNQHGQIIDLGTVDLQQERESGPKVLANLPYLNRLMKSKTMATETHRVLLIPSVEIVEQSIVVAYLEDYQSAIAGGRLSDAKRFAELALAADPKCFAK
jgi:hypothetical protein